MTRAAWLLLFASCSRDVELCDAEALSSKAADAVVSCEARGYDWESCPDRERILRELREELGRCSPR